MPSPRALLVVAALALVATEAPGLAAKVTPGAHVSTVGLDCRFTTWETEPQGPTAAGAQLLVGADVRCTQAKVITVRLSVTDGVDDVSAVAGPPNLLDGIDAGPRIGTVVATFRSAGQLGTQFQVAGHVPVPRPGHVYTVDAVTEFTSGCGRNVCQDYPPAPAAPPAPGVDLSLVANQAGSCMGTIDTYDEGCQYQFTVPG